MNSIAIYGATDRFNYGDLLFPLVLSHAVKRRYPNCHIENIAIVESDLRDRGGLPTRSLKEFIAAGHLDDYDRVIVAGGQVLNARWTAILGYLGAHFDFTLRASRKLFGADAADGIAKRIAGVPWPQPFVIPPGVFRKGVVAYNAVGGVNIENLPADYLAALARSIEAADYVSVRDTATQDAFRKLGVDAHLVPDSAVVMSSIFTKAMLGEQARLKVLEYVKQHSGGYLLFQIGINFVKGREASIARTIERIATEQGLVVSLLAIGTATGHEDQIALQNIRKHIDPSIKVFELYDGSIWEIMLLIADAALYLGTSLHGAITAISFGVPHLPFTNQVKKLQEFLMTWDLPEHANCLDIEDRSDKVAAVLSIGTEARGQLKDRVIEKAWSGMQRVVG